MNYAPQIEPKNAYDVLSKDENSFLVDVRTMPEWAYTGVANLSEINKKVITISWLNFPNMAANNNFSAEFLGAIPDKNSKIFFICKTGGRSQDAANNMMQIGYKNCFNITNGYEGDLNEKNQRSSINGWRASGLPWHQN